MARIIVPKVGHDADIAGHEFLHRESLTHLVIHSSEFQWDIRSNAEIIVTEREPNPEPSDDELDADYD